MILILIIVGIDYPVKISQIPKFEKQNEIRVNVFGYDEKEKNTHIFPRYVSDFDFKTTVNLLLISNGVQSHYILIKSLNALLQNKTNNSEVCFTDTENIYKNLEQIKEWMDFSNYPKSHFLHSELNKKIPDRLFRLHYTKKQFNCHLHYSKVQSVINEY